LNNPPSAKIIFPAEDEIVEGSVTIQVEVTDLEDNVVDVKVYYSTNNVSWELLGSSTSPTTPGGNIYEIPWNSNDVYDGNYYLKVVVTDNESLETEAYSGGFSVENDNVKPTKDKPKDAFADLWWLWILIIVIIIILCLLLVVWSKRRKKDEEAPRPIGAPSPDEARAILHEIAGAGPPEQVQPIPAGAPRPRLKKVKAAPQTLLTGYEGDLGAKVGDDLQNKLNAWRQQGYVVTKLEHLMETDMEALFLEMPKFKANIVKLTELKDRFNALDTTGFEDEDRSIREKFNNPDLVAKVEQEIIELEVKIDKRGELARLEAEAGPEEVEEAPTELEAEAVGEEAAPTEELSEEEELEGMLPEEPAEVEEPESEEEVPSEELEAADEEFEEELEAAEEEFEEDKGESDEDLEEFLPDTEESTEVTEAETDEEE
jgi:hypothetical protein